LVVLLQATRGGRDSTLKSDSFALSEDSLDLLVGLFLFFSLWSC
jgi:hypothetical protein